MRFWGCVGYHDFEGLTTRLDEQPRLVKSLGDNDALILRNHGLLTVGPDVQRTFLTLWTLQRLRGAVGRAGCRSAPGGRTPGVRQ